MRERIVQRALLCLSESTNDGIYYAGQDTFPVEQFVDEAGRKVVMLAPLRALGEGADAKAIAKTISEDGIVSLTLPDDFARLLAFKMSAWKRPVFIPIYDTDPQYAMQFHPATRGGIVKPVVAITKGGTEMEAYSTTADDTINTFKYISYETADDVPDKLEEAAAWMTASLYLASMGELDMAKVLESKSIEMLQLV